MSNARFSITPSRAVKDPELSDAVYRTLAALGIYGDDNGWCWPSLKSLAEIRGKTRQACSKDIQILKQKGYLNVQPRFDKDKGQRSNKYQIKFDYPPSTSEDYPTSTPQVDTPSTSEDYHNAPLNAPLNAPIEEIAADAAPPTGTNGVVVFGEGQAYAEVQPPLSPEQQMIAGFYSKPAMMDKWYEWEAYRVERKKKLTPTTRNKQIKFLLDQGEDAIAIMEQSMTAGWLGLFPLKQNGHAPKPAQPTPALPSEEELNRQRADVAAKVAARNAKRKAGIQDPDDF